MNTAYRCDAVRTPFGRFGGALASVRTDGEAWAFPGFEERLWAERQALDEEAVNLKISG